MKQLIEKSLLELTLPDKPNSRLQKYRLTTKGRAALERQGGAAPVWQAPATS